MPGETRFVDVLVVDAPDEAPGAVTGGLLKAVLTSVPEPRRSPWSRALMHTIPNLNEDRLCAAEGKEASAALAFGQQPPPRQLESCPSLGRQKCEAAQLECSGSP